MNMFARFDENPAMTLRVIKETKRYGRTDAQRENSIPPTNKVCRGGGGGGGGGIITGGALWVKCEWQENIKTLTATAAAWPCI